MSYQNLLDFIRDKTTVCTIDFTKIKFGEVPIYIISKVSKKLISVFYISLKNLNDELSTFLENFDNKNIELYDFESKEIINNLKSSVNENAYNDFEDAINEAPVDTLNDGFDNLTVQTNIPELEAFNEIKTNKIIIDKFTTRKLQKQTNYSKIDENKRYIPNSFIVALNSLTKNYSEILRNRGTASSSITLDAFESADITIPRYTTDSFQHPFIDPDVLGNFEEERSYILEDKLENMNQLEKGEYILNLLKRAQSDELNIEQENAFGKIFINLTTPE